MQCVYWLFSRQCLQVLLIQAADYSVVVSAERRRAFSELKKFVTAASEPN